MNRVSWMIAIFVVTSAAHAIELIDRLETRIQADIKTDLSGVRYLELQPTRYARALTEAIDVVPGKKYRFTLDRYGEGIGHINARPLLYDEDDHLLSCGEYSAPVKMPGFTYYPSWKTGMNRSVVYEIPKGVKTLKILLSSEKLARIRSVRLEDAGGEAFPEPPRPPESAYEVVVPERRSEPIAFAASELRHFIYRISGRRATLATGKASNAAGKTRIYLGRDFLKVDTGRFDSWAIERRGEDIYLTANLDEGVCNAVYDLLERNTDIIFTRAESENGGVIFTPDPGLKFIDCTSRVEPKYEDREFGFVGCHFHPQTALYCRRNYLNGRSMYYQKWHIASTATVTFRWKLAYELGGLIPNDVYFEKHPEWYGMREEQRRKYEHYGTQICYMSEEGRREITKNLLSRLKSDLVPGVRTVALSYGDTWDLCRCPECVRPVKLPSGRVLTEDDRDFRSYQYYRFVTRIARDVAKVFPDLQIDSGGYLYSAVPPPETEFPENFAITFCPYPKVCRVPVTDDKHNARWHAASEGWGKAGCGVNIYEYYGDATGWPRPGCDNAAKDLMYWNRLGFSSRIYCEMPPDVREFAVRNKGGYAASWDLSAMENWVMARLFVDPTRDVAALRKEFCRRAFREGAALMEEFYGIIHKRWYQNPNYQGWGENPVVSMNADIRSAGLEKRLSELLRRAETAASHPGSKALIASARSRWAELIAAAEKAAPPPASIPCLKSSRKGMPPFNDPAWKKGFCETNFHLNAVGKKTLSPKGRTHVSAFHDNERLYVRFLSEGRPTLGGKEVFPSGDSVGLLVRPKKNLNDYRHLLAAPNGRGYDAKAYDHTWDAEGFSVAVDCNQAAWRAVLSVPLGEIGVNPTVPGEVYIAFVRSTVEDGVRKTYTSTGFMPHRADRFKPVEIQTK